MTDVSNSGRARRFSVALLVASAAGALFAIVGITGAVLTVLTGRWLLGSALGIMSLLFLVDHVKRWRSERRLYRLLSFRESGKLSPTVGPHWASLSIGDKLRQIADEQDRTGLRYSPDGLRRLAAEADDALFDERADGWDEGHRASGCVYSPDCDLNDHHPNPYRTPKEC